MDSGAREFHSGENDLKSFSLKYVTSRNLQYTQVKFY